VIVPCLLLASTGAHAQQLVDATRGVVLTTSDMLAMGGAGMGFAAGASGTFFHPAAPAVRRRLQRGYLSPSMELSLFNVGFGQSLGVDGLPDEDLSARFGMTNIALATTIGPAGAGLATSGTRYRADGVEVAITEGHLAVAGSFADGHTTLGLGLRTLSVEATGNSDLWMGEAAFEGGALELGMHLVEPDAGWNVGGAWRAPVHATRVSGQQPDVVSGVSLPSQMVIGASYASRAMRRSDLESVPVRFAADAVWDGKLSNAVGLEGLLMGQVVERGAEPTLSPRIGVEVEPARNRFRFRTGSYWEPTRADAESGRLHLTAGTQLRIVRVRILRGWIDQHLSWTTALDAADGYLNTGFLSLGFWGVGVVGNAYQWAQPT